MKKLISALSAVLFLTLGQADSQVVYFPANINLEKDAKAFVEKIVKTRCAEAIKHGDVSVTKKEIRIEEIDQGVRDTYITLTMDVDYNTNDDDSDEIVMVVEHFEIANPRFPSYYLETLSSTGGVCNKYP